MKAEIGAGEGDIPLESRTASSTGEIGLWIAGWAAKGRIPDAVIPGVAPMSAPPSPHPIGEDPVEGRAVSMASS